MSFLVLIPDAFQTIVQIIIFYETQINYNICIGHSHLSPAYMDESTVVNFCEFWESPEFI
jgi:hypothetical protein